MAKYNWIELEKEYMLSEEKSIRAFFRRKDIPYNKNTQKQSKGWKEKKTAKERHKDGKNNRESY